MDGSAPLVVELLDAAPTHCGAGKLVCIDGRSAAGKSTVAGQVAGLLEARGTRVRVLHTDAMLEGWRGVLTLADTLSSLVTAWDEGRTGTWREWDWHQQEWSSLHDEPPLEAGEVVILEGVGAAAGPWSRLASVAVWMEIDAAEQRERWTRRGDDLAALDQWAHDEQSLHARWNTKAQCELLLTTH